MLKIRAAVNYVLKVTIAYFNDTLPAVSLRDRKTMETFQDSGGSNP
jgi:hypothetical protein